MVGHKTLSGTAAFGHAKPEKCAFMCTTASSHINNQALCTHCIARSFCGLQAMANHSKVVESSNLVLQCGLSVRSAKNRAFCAGQENCHLIGL
jgi:hypothetical protein